MTKEELVKLIEEQAELGKTEVAALLIGIFSAAIAIGKEAKDKKERLLFVAILVLIGLQGVMIGALLWLK